MSTIADIKNSIKSKLDELVVATILGGASESDYVKDVLGADIPAYPYAYLMPPSTSSTAVDNRTLLRTYNFAILVIVKAENISSSTEIETLQENIMNKFDNLPTLNGNADGGVLPASSEPEPVQHQGKQLVIFTINLVVNKTQTLTF